MIAHNETTCSQSMLSSLQLSHMNPPTLEVLLISLTCRYDSISGYVSIQQTRALTSTIRPDLILTNTPERRARQSWRGS